MNLQRSARFALSAVVLIVSAGARAGAQSVAFPDSATALFKSLTGHWSCSGGFARGGALAGHWSCSGGLGRGGALVGDTIKAPPFAPNRFNYSVTGANGLKMVWEVGRNGAWPLGDSLVCARGA